MRTLYTLLGPLAVALSCAGPLSAQADSTLIVSLLDVPDDQGYVLVALYDDPAHWNKPELAKYVRRAPASAGRLDVDFAHLAPGRYAVAALHDRDTSGTMTTGWFGIPMEAYGFGNDARGTFGAPPYEACVVEFDGRGRTQIALK